tara:strand:- start:40 stop:300 length:261 start_codon:yes stop_codon:yes gene_type:complete
MTINNLTNHLKYFNINYIKLNNTTIVFTPNTSPQLEVLSFTSEVKVGSDKLFVFDFNKQTAKQFEYEPSIGESVDYIIEREGGLIA